MRPAIAAPRRSQLRGGSSRSRACALSCSRAGCGTKPASRRCKGACSEEVEAAVKQYLATPKQSTDAMFDYLYAQLPPVLRAQREEARRYAALGH